MMPMGVILRTVIEVAPTFTNVVFMCSVAVVHDRRYHRVETLVTVRQQHRLTLHDTLLHRHDDLRV